MSRTFAYARVSTFDQTPENQIREIEAAGFAVEPHRIVAETVGGSRSHLLFLAAAYLCLFYIL